ncbi:putative Ig domain-containing protein [Runella zeae]|uniref:putative Ig domain-containing protein n=1 Tax=Runella zeae TaxID=94255 RepID=UPI0004049ED7|nr:putative Ig domain-containing protein [Runella zeae]
MTRKSFIYPINFCILILLWGAVSILAPNVVAQNSDQQRYVGLQLLNLDPSPEAGLDIIEASIQNGCNLVALTIQWDEVYKTATSAGDWRQYDRQIEYIAKTNAKIALRIMVNRLSYRLDGFWTADETMKDDLGRPLNGVYSRTCFSFAHQPTVEKAQRFIQEVCQRYNTYQQQGKILYVSFGNLPTQELGFSHENQFGNDKAYLACYDYSTSSISAYRQWAQARYKTINKLNYHCKTKFTSFQTLLPPNTSYNPLPAFRQKSGKDWYIFLHSQLKTFINTTIGKVKEINNSYKIVNEFGTVTDDFSAMLVSYAFKDLGQLADGNKVHNDPYYNHRWITDVMRSNSTNKWILNEVFYYSQTPTDRLIRQFDECFEHGCKIVTFVVGAVEPASMQLLRNISQKWLNAPLNAIQASREIPYTLTEALDFSLTNNQKKWQEQYAQNASPIHIPLTEDILSEEYWRPLAVNVPPIVSQPIGNRATKPKRSFNYTLPKEVFSDPDGEIVRIEVLEKPQWLTFSNGAFSGTSPEQLGDYQIKLKATDDEGASVETTFKLSIVNVNQKPIVKNTIPDFESQLEQLIYYQFYGDIFDDPDGTIARIQTFGLRPWMTFTPKDFSAYPREQGTFTITLRGYDEDSAFVETSFKVKILNQLPIVKQPLPVKDIGINRAFRFKIPTSMFADPDGQITQIKAVNLPSWLTFDAPTTTLRGTPTQLGEYRVGIRAYDTVGDSVQTTFVIKVTETGTLNAPPILRYSIPNAQLFITQRFNYKIADSLFYDTNGYVDRIEAPNLPSWLTFKNNELSGIATTPGFFTVTIRAVDDDETSTSTTFQIEVKQAKLSFELIQAGKVGTRVKIRDLKNNDILTENALPPRITIYANSETLASKVDFSLRGPYQKNFTATRFPFALFDEETGFMPIAGRYLLEAIAYNDSVKVSSAQIWFTVTASQVLSEWQVYPNPFESVCNIKLPTGIDPQHLQYQLVSTSGQVIKLSASVITIVDDVAYINVASLSLPSGTYVLGVYDKEKKIKSIKVLKR